MKIRRRDFLKGIASGGVLAVIGKPDLALATERQYQPGALGILYDATLCVGCQSCMVACKKANNMPMERTRAPGVWDDPVDLSSSTLNIIKKYQHGEGQVKDSVDGYSFVKRHCMHCVEPSCVSACPVSALTKDKENGIVGYNKERCIGCRYCQIACPFNIPKFQWDDPTPEIVKCQLCSHLVEKGGISACCEACPTGASLFGPVESLINEAKRRQQMVPGKYYDFPISDLSGRTSPEFKSRMAAKYVPEIYGEYEVGGTQVLHMAGVPFNKLGFPDLPHESYASISDGIQYAIYKGMVYPIVVLGGLIYMVNKREGGDKEE
ncbi:MAG: hydrogenase 2 operon protein HybA [Proteobacteria bacterium]|nr:hydrogenase 2 operon protein HybA [Pseudomonadota bacterium]MBU1736587.1 hydrogenase 2 operon protein HybA [Pseudomonadota bacterium]